jgi:hypothetical protein
MVEAYFDKTVGDAFIPELWSQEAMLARESRLIMAGLVRRLDAAFASFGDKLYLQLVGNLSAGNISTSDGSLDATTDTASAVAVDIDKWKGVVINVLDITKVQANQDLLAIYGKKMGYALGLIVEQDLFALAPGLTTNEVGTFNTALDDIQIRLAVQKLDESRTPFEDRHFVFKPDVKNTLLGIDKFVRYDGISYPVGSSPIVKGNIGELYGVMCHVSPEVYKTSNNTSNLMFHREAFGLAMQKGVKMEQFARTSFTQRVGGSELYGVKTLRQDQACEVKS